MTSPSGGRRDALADWLRIRTEISWPRWSGGRPAAGPPVLDGVRDFLHATRGGRDPEGAVRVLTALDQSLADANQGRQLTLALMAGWQRTVLRRDPVGFRTMPAFAKGGRERYGLEPDTPGRFEECLSESAQSDLPLPSRAARTYLDVLFFHPFEDGNARAAMLALAFVLARDGVSLDQAHSLQTTRWADDADGAADLALLLGILLTAARRRSSPGQPQEQRSGMAKGRPGTTSFALVAQRTVPAQSPCLLLRPRTPELRRDHSSDRAQDAPVEDCRLPVLALGVAEGRLIPAVAGDVADDVVVAEHSGGWGAGRAEEVEGGVGPAARAVRVPRAAFHGQPTVLCS
ncbi:Fic family protein (plasmid) [Streptomyces sp. NBC_01471]|uniref:Fic family protein n=1 Tax=Streptomyces sp. NBC_01471 TaxID=2903879 RepID=UPI002F918D36